MQNIHEVKPGSATTKNLEQELRQAAANGDVRKVRALLTAGVPTSGTSSNGYTALDWCLVRYEKGKDFEYWIIALFLLAHTTKYKKELKDKSAMTKEADQLILFDFAKELQETYPDYFKFFLTNYYFENTENEDFRRFQSLYVTCKMLPLLFNILGNARTNALSHLNQPKESINILSLGCRECHELLPLKFLFKDCEINYVGVDLDKEAIDYCKNVFGAEKNLQFFHADATDLKALAKLELKAGSFHLVIIRHPNFVTQASVFQNIIFNTAPIFMKSKGVLYLSFYEPDLEIYLSHNKITQNNKVINQQYVLNQDIYLEKPQELVLVDLKDQRKTYIVKPDQYSFYLTLANEFLPKLITIRKGYEKCFKEAAPEITDSNLSIKTP